MGACVARVHDKSSQEGLGQFATVRRIVPSIIRLYGINSVRRLLTHSNVPSLSDPQAVTVSIWKEECPRGSAGNCIKLYSTVSGRSVRSRILKRITDAVRNSTSQSVVR